ncbi:MAG TPA: hypothetical protein VFH38_04515 [Jatrophihabitans sp.]|nr:hypothetical protein [Jatrophihabitans sp.]
MQPADAVWAPRWRGRPGRLEVWYTTLTDPRTGTGAWLHTELVAPADGAPAFAHGWVAVFPPGAAPLVDRFGPRDVVASAPRRAPSLPEIESGPRVHAGQSRGASWTLTAHWPGSPLYTFPRWSWQHDVLPAAQLVATPGARYDGTICIAGQEFVFSDARGASSRIYGTGNAHRWAWLHADLDDDTTLEAVAAVSHLTPLRRLAPLTFVRMRTPAGDLPAVRGLSGPARWHADIARGSWTAAGPLAAGQRLRIAVRLPTERTVTLDYAEPRGHAVRCSNSERADAVVEWKRRAGRRWVTVRSWQLRGTAHAEIGGAADQPVEPGSDSGLDK